MPYEMFEQDGQFCLRNQQTGKMVPGSCHKMKADTMTMMRALYANVPDARKKSQDEEYNMTDSLTYYGSTVKALGNGKIGGYVAIFTTKNDPDLQGDFFTKSTEFYLEDGDQRPIIYDHGLDKTIKRRQLGRATVKIDDAGVWMEGQLNLRDDYEQKVYKMAEMGKLGWSTGSASHLVTRTQQGKSYHLDSWPIVEASLTPMPVEPRTVAVPLKSVIAAHVDIDDLMKSFQDEEAIKASALENFPALSAIVAPVDLKGWDEGSDTVAAAVKEHLKVGKVLIGAVKSFAVRLSDSARLRFERDGRPVSKAKRQWVEATRRDLQRHIEDVKSLDAHLAEIQKQFDTTEADEQSANEEARFELLRTHKITGTSPL